MHVLNIIYVLQLGCLTDGDSVQCMAHINGALHCAEVEHKGSCIAYIKGFLINSQLIIS